MKLSLFLVLGAFLVSASMASASECNKRSSAGLFSQTNPKEESQVVKATPAVSTNANKGAK